MKIPLPLKLHQFGSRFPLTVLLFCLLLTGLSLFFAARLRIQSDLTSLLPPEMESVKRMNELAEHFGGLGFLYLAVESGDPERAARFANKLAGRIEKHPGVLYVDFRRPVEFFKKRQWLYVDREDLEEMERRVTRARKLEKKGVSPVFNDLMDFAGEEDRPDLSFSDILEKYKKRFSLGEETAVSSDEGRFLVLRVKSKGDSQNFESNRKLIEEIRRIEQEVRRGGAFEGVKVGFAGTYQKSIEQSDLIRTEIGRVSGVVGVLLFLILFFYFRRFLPAVLVAGAVACGVLWTGGVVSLLLGHLNIITSFAAAILAGLGSDYGIYLLTRYYQERGRGRDLKTAGTLAFSNTGRATHLCMLTTAGGFGALLLSRFQLFFEFGVVGAVGIFLNYIAMMLILPAAVALEERWRPAKVSRRRSLHGGAFVARAGFFFRGGVSSFITLRGAPYKVLLFSLLCVAAGLSLPRQSRIRFDDGQIESRRLPSYALTDRISRLSPNALNPTVLLVEKARERKTVRVLGSLLETEEGERLPFKNVIGLSTFLPEGEAVKKKILVRIERKIARLGRLLKTHKEKLRKSLRDSIDAPPITRDSLPREVRQIFEAQGQGRSGLHAVYLYPSFGRVTSESMKRYHDGIKDLQKSSGLRFAAVDGTFISDDILSLIRKEAPPGGVLVLAFLTAVVWFGIRSRRRMMIVMANLVGSLILLSGVLYLLKIPLNVINIGVLPVLLGTGIDCFIHFSHRLDESGHLLKTVEDKTAPIFVSNITSLVGFGGLLLTSSEGIRSAGAVAVLGIVLITLVCFYIFPQCLAVEGPRLLTGGEPRREGDALPENR